MNASRSIKNASINDEGYAAQGGNDHLRTETFWTFAYKCKYQQMNATTGNKLNVYKWEYWRCSKHACMVTYLYLKYTASARQERGADLALSCPEL